MNIDRASLLLAVSLLGLSGCTPMDPGFGESTRLNAAVQTIDPEPAYDEELASASGDKMAPAIERYRTDKVKAPKGIKTTSGITSGGSGGGSR